MSQYKAQFKRITRVANLPRNLDRVNRGVFIVIEWDGARLSVTGVEGPKANGNAVGSCGQIVMHEWDDYLPCGVDLDTLRAMWDRWHLNDMRAGNPEQEECLRVHRVRVQYPASQYESDCEVLAAHGLLVSEGYKYGTAWKYEPVPEDVLRWFYELPEDGTEMPSVWH